LALLKRDEKGRMACEGNLFAAQRLRLRHVELPAGGSWGD